MKNDFQALPTNITKQFSALENDFDPGEIELLGQLMLAHDEVEMGPDKRKDLRRQIQIIAQHLEDKKSLNSGAF